MPLADPQLHIKLGTMKDLMKALGKNSGRYKTFFINVSMNW
jgi:hypothetical protein